MTSITDRGLTALRGALQSRPEADDEHFARARAECAVVTEQYRMTQEISESPTRDLSEPAPGEIVVTIPYDGRKYFTRQAADDVALMGEQLSGDASVIAGHLVLAPSLRASANRSLALSDARAVIPLRVPVSGPSLGSPETLVDDTQTCVLEHKYAISQPPLAPISVKIEPKDPDTVEDVHDIRAMLRSDVERAVELLRSRSSFQHYLAFLITVRLDLPRRTGSAAGGDDDELRPVVRRVELEWPTITALDAQVLHIANEPEERQRKVIYDPQTQLLVWTDVRLIRDKSDADMGPDIDTYVSPPMLLLAMSPGQLYKAECVAAHVDIEIPDYLLSGLDVRMFSATGQPASLQPKLRTLIHSDVSLYLADRFATREMSPWQHLYFGEVKPDTDRINDVVTVLGDCGYRLDPEPPVLAAAPSGAIKRVLRASRREGPANVELVLFIEGEERETVRTRGVGDTGDGDQFRSKLQSGEIRLFVQGYHPRDSQVVVRDINRIDEELRQRYARAGQPE